MKQSLRDIDHTGCCWLLTNHSITVIIIYLGYTISLFRHILQTISKQQTRFMGGLMPYLIWLFMYFMRPKSLEELKRYTYNCNSLCRSVPWLANMGPQQACRKCSWGHATGRWLARRASGEQHKLHMFSLYYFYSTSATRKVVSRHGVV